MTELSRRELLKTAVAVPVAAAFRRPRQPRVTLDEIAKSRSYAVADGGTPGLTIHREWRGDTCRSRIVNDSTAPIRVREVVLADLDLDMPLSTGVYGESFQMLSQSGGTLGAPKDLGSYTDAKHYRIPMAEGAQTYFGAMTLSPPGAPVRGLAFTSIRRFAGSFRLRQSARSGGDRSPSLQVVVDLEGLTLAPGERSELEELVSIQGATRDSVLGEIGARISQNHPPRPWPVPPTGWCSWYCFGARVTAQNVLDNLDAIAKSVPGLTYIQIDDGYQPAMGDWLETGTAFGGGASTRSGSAGPDSRVDVRKVLDAIRRRGFRPAIWVAPFIAEEQSHVFQRHPDWFVKDTDGTPLRSDKVTFGGWRRAPWYVLDGTHPDVHAHFERVFGTMRREWGVDYFKLDANFWGAIHGGHFHDATATRVEAYRRGMAAILRGAGDSFILGCNHPIWPSVGLIHGSRSSNDIKRTWDRVKTTAQQNLLRGWQNGRLWWNDPDAVCLSGDLPENEYVFHATAIYASGGMLLSGDDLTTLPEPRVAMLKKLIPPTGVAATFDDDTLQIGTVRLPGKTMFCCFNWADTSVSLARRLEKTTRVTDFWTGTSLGRLTQIVLDVPPHSARLLEAVDA